MEIDIFDKDFYITKLTKVGDFVAAFIMKLRESSTRYNGENFYILKSDLQLYLIEDNLLPVMLNKLFSLTKLDLSEFEFDKGISNVKIYDNKYTNADYVHVGKLRKFLNEKYKAYNK